MQNSAFKAKRKTFSYRQSINALPEQVFPLLCPVREAEWLDGWRYTMIYSQSGLVEAGAVFSTTQEGEADTIWIVTKHDPSQHTVEFARFTPNAKTCVLNVNVRLKEDRSSYVDITYTYTGLAPAGNTFIETFTEDQFIEAVVFWEKSMNYFLDTGKMLKKGK